MRRKQQEQKTTHTVQIIMEFPKHWPTEEKAKEDATRKVNALVQRFPDAVIEHTIWEHSAS